ncbi:MAG: hypothetical protein F4160_11235 [Rhodospirillaceae bacterium]|nr:hypothetical protein [Rhodospirillaceae bacterium]
MKRDGLTLEFTDPKDDHRVIQLWTLESAAAAAVLATLRRESVAGRARCTFDGNRGQIIDGAPAPMIESGA